MDITRPPGQGYLTEIRRTCPNYWRKFHQHTVTLTGIKIKETTKNCYLLPKKKSKCVFAMCNFLKLNILPLSLPHTFSSLIG